MPRTFEDTRRRATKHSPPPAFHIQVLPELHVIDSRSSPPFPRLLPDTADLDAALVDRVSE
jgi:hypothetical protein